METFWTIVWLVGMALIIGLRDDWERRRAWDITIAQCWLMSAWTGLFYVPVIFDSFLGGILFYIVSVPLCAFVFMAISGFEKAMNPHEDDPDARTGDKLLASHNPNPREWDKYRIKTRPGDAQD